MRFAYADPPYLGCGVKRYGHHPSAAEYDDAESHRALVRTLCDGSFDGWAMSMSSVSLWTILPACPMSVRVGAWVKPFASFKPNVNPGYCWEPVIFWGGRKRTRDQPTIRDFVSAPITLRKGLVGAKPDAFCRWLFDFLGMEPSDDFVDLFPGTGAVSRSWEAWRRQRSGQQEVLTLGDQP